MRIVTYFHGKLISSENPAYALADYLAFMDAYYHPGQIEELGSERAFIAAVREYFDDWLEAIIKDHEYHVVDLSGNRLYDQYLVTKDIDYGKEG